MRKNFDIVFFDLGDTLIYFNGQWSEVMGQAIHEMVLFLSRNDTNFDTENFENRFRQRINEYYIERDEKCIEYTMERVLRSLIVEMGYHHSLKDWIRPALNAMYAVTEEFWTVEKDAVSTLKILQGKGFHLGLISNAADANDVQVLLEKTQLLPFFEVIMVSADFGLRKPHSKIFKAALKHWHADASRAVMVGDTLEADILGARKVGMASVWITRRVQDKSERLSEVNYRPDAEIETLSQLIPLLKNWKK